MMTVTSPDVVEPVHYLPPKGWVGDVIPFEWDGEFWLFYLLENRDEPLSGTGWALVVTRDFVTYEDRGVVLPSGGPDAADFNCYTGSLVADQGVVHLFYTGQNPWRLAPDGTTPLQLVMHASSSDGMQSWQKHPELTFGAPKGYEPGDWRDPFVFRTAEGEPWRLLLAARHARGPERRRGVVAQLTSADLLSWSEAEPFWDPRRYVAHECPDVFQQGGWWYLVYSEFSESFSTRYRMARSPQGPWLVPELDSIDGRAFYASKSVARGDRRFFVGWIATKAGEVDDGAWEWAGTMSVLETEPAADGTLSFFLPSEITDQFVQPAPPTAFPPETDATVSAPDSYCALVAEGEAPDQFLARITVDIKPGTRECGVLLRASPDGDQSYVLRLEPSRNRLVFDRWPRKRTGPMQWQISGDRPHAVELERACPLSPGRHTIELVVDTTTLIAVVDRKVALSARIYDRPAGRLGVFVGEGAAAFTHVEVLQRLSRHTPTKEAQ